MQQKAVYDQKWTAVSIPRYTVSAAQRHFKNSRCTHLTNVGLTNRRSHRRTHRGHAALLILCPPTFGLARRLHGSRLRCCRSVVGLVIKPSLGWFSGVGLGLVN